MRKWINILAALAVLLHATALVRHNGAMLQHQALLADLGVICHDGTGAAKLPASDLPGIPKPSDTQSSCPICSGLVAAFALPAAAVTTLPAPPEAAEPHFVSSVSLAELPRGSLPPATGPPAHI